MYNQSLVHPKSFACKTQLHDINLSLAGEAGKDIRTHTHRHHHYTNNKLSHKNATCFCHELNIKCDSRINKYK